MEWPSNRVAQGGIFQPAKVNYSPKTKAFLKELMEESKLTMLQRQKINYSLRSGDPLPKLHLEQPERRQRQPELLFRPGSSKRRQYNSIVESGAYEPERYVPTRRGIDREYAKRHLQDFMAYGKEIRDQPKPVKKKEEPKINRFDELKQEIQERIDWLEDMEKIGEGYKYRQLIQQQIATRINEMEQLKTEEAKS